MYTFLRTHAGMAPDNIKLHIHDYPNKLLPHQNNWMYGWSPIFHKDIICKIILIKKVFERLHRMTNTLAYSWTLTWNHQFLFWIWYSFIKWIFQQIYFDWMYYIKRKKRTTKECTSILIKETTQYNNMCILFLMQL